MILKVFLLLATCFLLLLSGGCATTEHRAGQAQPLQQGGASPVPTIATIAPTIVWPPPPQTPRIQFLRILSMPADIGVKKSSFKRAFDVIFGREDMEERILRPYGVFADSDRIYVTDPGAHRIHIFDMKEKRYFEIKEVKGEEIVSPIGVAADKNGEIYISDSYLKRVFVFDKKGKYLREIGSADLFIRPAGIALVDDRLYVVDTHAHHVLVFTKKDGELLFRFGQNGDGKGEFNYPTNIFVRDRLLYIMDSMNFRVQIFGKEGDFISAFGKLGDGSGDFSKPKGIAVDSEGHIYVADAHFDNVQIFDKDGKLLLGFGNTGRKEGEMILPAGVFIDEKDMVYVVDSYNNRVQVFQYLKKKK